ncbi:MAG: hypothetical protein QM742_19305 [Aquabacterium sp.]
MNPITDPSSIAQQISRTEAAIEASNQRLHDLKSHLRTSARQTLRASRKPLIIGGILVVALGVVLYPRRHQVMHQARRVANSPLVTTLLQRLPMLGMLLPLIGAARGQEGAASGGARMGALLSAALPLLARFMPHAFGGRRPPAV